MFFFAISAVSGHPSNVYTDDLVLAFARYDVLIPKEVPNSMMFLGL